MGKQDTPDRYQYGKLDYVGDIWNIDVADNTFDAVLCTEVFEHIPYPNDTVAELSRLIKPGGKANFNGSMQRIAAHGPLFLLFGL